jgi:hypothetical protein
MLLFVMNVSETVFCSSQSIRSAQERTPHNSASATQQKQAERCTYGEQNPAFATMHLAHPETKKKKKKKKSG